MKKYLLIIVFCHFVVASSQQLLWSTELNSPKKINTEEVYSRVMQLYDVYDYYYDGTGYTKSEFGNILKQNDVFNGAQIKELHLLNERIYSIDKPTYFAYKSNNGQGAIVYFILVNLENIELISFSDVQLTNANFSRIQSRKKFSDWYISTCESSNSTVKYQNVKLSDSDLKMLENDSILNVKLLKSQPPSLQYNRIDPAVSDGLGPEIPNFSDAPVAVAQISASYPGGIVAFKRYVNENFNPARLCPQNTKNREVVLKFVVSHSGVVSNVSAINESKSCPEFTQEAIRILNSSKRWIPAQNNGLFLTSWREITIRSNELSISNQ